MPQYKYTVKAGVRWFSKFPYQDPLTGEKKIEFKRGFMTKREAKTYEDSFMDMLQKRLSEEAPPKARTFCDVYRE